MPSLPIFLINLDRSADRLRRMQDQAAHLSNQFTRVRGVDGLVLPDNMRPEFLNPDGSPRSRMLPGEVGCYASHMRAWEHVIDNRLSHAMVLEDDVILEPELAAVAAAAVKSCPAGWDLIHLHASANKKKLIRVAQLEASYRLVRFTRLPINACAYLISQSGARKMRQPGPRVRPVDVEMRHGYLRNMDIYGVWPSIVENGPLDDASSIIGRTAQRIAQHRRQWDPSLLHRACGQLFNWHKAARSILQAVRRAPSPTAAGDGSQA